MVEVTLRPAELADRDFLAAVYASTREEELAPVPWTAEEKAIFLRSQFDAQDVYYKRHYPAADYLVIQAGAEAAGRLYVARLPREIRIVDIALLPKFRGLGAGTTVLKALLEEADRDAKPVSIHVERGNRALSFYDRLGFRFVEDKGVYLFLVRPPAITAS